MDLTEFHKRFKWCGNLILLLASISICFMIGEAAFRLLVKGGVAPALDAAGGAIVRDAEKGWKSNSAYRFVGEQASKDGSRYPVTITFYPEGFRQYGDNHTLRPKVLVIGDSFTQAEQVSNEKTYYALLGKRLEVEIFAYGCGGYGTLQELQVLDRYIDNIKPDILIWQFCFNDFVNNNVDLEAASTRNNNGLMRPYWIDGKVKYLIPKGKFERTARSALGWSRLAAYLFNRFDKLKSTTNPDASIEAVLLKEGMQHTNYSRSLKTTDELLGEVRQRVGEIPVVGLYVNGLRPKEDAPAKSAFRILCKKYGFTFIESAAAVEKAEQRGEIVRHSDGAHWNERGHALTAGLIIEVLPALLTRKQFDKE